MQVGVWLQRRVGRNGVENRGVPLHGLTPKQARQVAHPRLVDPGARYGAKQTVGRGPGSPPVGVRAEEGVDVDSHQSAGNAPRGKMRAAFLQRTSSSSGGGSKRSR